MKRAVLFDLDGTLLDTLEDLCNAVNRVLSLHEFPVHPLDAYRYFIGDGAKVLFERALPPECRDEATVQQCLTEFRYDYGKNWNVATRPYPGIPALLDELTTRAVDCCVLSNKPHETTEQCVLGLLPHWTFRVILGQREGVPKKPDPAAALEIARRLGLLPSDVLYLGDTGTDMETAVAAGMFPVGALWGFRPEQELREHGARVCVASPADVIPLLDD